MEYKIQFIIILNLFILFLLYYFIQKLRSKITSLEQELKREKNGKRLLNILPFPIFCRDKNGKITYLNNSFKTSFGINTKKTSEILSTFFKKSIENIELNFDNDIKKQVQVFFSNILDENKNITGDIGAIFDISNFRKDIDILLHWKRRYQLAVEGSLYGLWDWNIQDNSIYFSSQWKKIMGYESIEKPNSLSSWLGLVDVRDIARVNEALNKHLNGKSDIFIIEHRVKLSKNLKWVSIRGKAIFDNSDNAIRMSGLIIDITHRKLVESELNKSQKLFATFMDNLPAIAFIKDKNNKYIYINSFYENYIGFKKWKNKTPNEIFDKKTAKKILENDRRAFYEGIKKHEEIIPNVEGTPKYFEAYKFPIDNGNNEKLLCGFGIDITKEKAYQDKLHLYAAIFNSTSESILITDKNINIIAVNKAFEKITGYTQNEAIGKNPSFLKSEKQDDNFYSLMNKALKEKGAYSGEIFNVNKNGDILPELVTISSTKNKQDEIVNYFVIYQSIKKQKKTEEKLKKLATYDNLTKLPNRFLFEDRLQNSLKRAERLNIKIALVFVDLDNFKTVNDTLGHDAGDIVLVQVAKKLKLSVRENDTVARLGGDEFVIILEDIKNIENLHTICTKILKNLNVPFKLINDPYQINASLGVSISPDHTKNYHELLKFSDQAMYEAKNSGKNTVAIYKPH